MFVIEISKIMKMIKMNNIILACIETKNGKTNTRKIIYKTKNVDNFIDFLEDKGLYISKK